MDFGLLPISSQSFSFDDAVGGGLGAAGGSRLAVRSAGLRPGVGCGAGEGGVGRVCTGWGAEGSGRAGVAGAGLVGVGAGRGAAGCRAVSERGPRSASAARSRRLARHSACRLSKGSRSSALAGGAPGKDNPCP